MHSHYLSYFRIVTLAFVLSLLHSNYHSCVCIITPSLCSNYHSRIRTITPFSDTIHAFARSLLHSVSTITSALPVLLMPSHQYHSFVPIITLTIVSMSMFSCLQCSWCVILHHTRLHVLFTFPANCWKTNCINWPESLSLDWTIVD